MNDFSDDIYVITRAGNRELLSYDKITARLEKLIKSDPVIPNVSSTCLMKEVTNSILNNITTVMIDEYTANIAATLSINNPYYLKLAGRIAIDNHQKTTFNSFVDTMKLAYYYKDANGNPSSIICNEFKMFIEEHQTFIGKIIDYNRDFLLDFFGFRTFQKQYSIKINDKAIERPQDLFMRTAVALNYKSKLDIDTILKNIQETYDMLSKKVYTHASPTYYNAGTQFPQYASCFLLGTHDSLEGIMKTATDMSSISKWAGGIGIHVSSLRSTGTRINGTNGNSSGIVPFIRIYESCMSAFNQGGRRPGSAKIYLHMHHPDVQKFIELRRNSGTEHNRVRGLFYALWVPDIFMQRVKDDLYWSFFDPHNCGDLSNYHSTEYNKRYIQLENEKKYSHQVRARELWELICAVNSEVGMPDILFCDTINKLSSHSNLGTIKSSNLCNEIVQYSSNTEYATCILSSISLPVFVSDSYSKEELEINDLDRRLLNHEFPLYPYFDFAALREVVNVVVRNLNNLIDTTRYPVQEAENGAMRQRSIGVGVQGLDDAYSKMRFPFESESAADLNKKIFETIYYAALSASTKLAKQTYKEYKKQCKQEGSVAILQSKFEDISWKDASYVVYQNAEEIPQTSGAYPGFLWNGGCPLAQGKFHFELAGKTTSDLTGWYDWESLRSHIMQFGVKNSMLVALMPTASTSQLMSNNECFEPYTSNIYKRVTSAGSYFVIKKYLINDLYNSKLWSNDIKEHLIAAEGSVQYIENIPDSIKNLYKTAWEINPEVIIQQAIDRQPFVDQAQSMNLWIKDFDIIKWNKLMFMAWKGGLKTGKYYLHVLPGSRPLSFTISKDKMEQIEMLKERVKINLASMEQKKDICDVCSA